MRTTLNLDADVMFAARELAERQRKPLGQILSDLARKGLARPEESPNTRNGFLLMPLKPGAGVVTSELVNRLRDESE